MGDSDRVKTLIKEKFSKSKMADKGKPAPDAKFSIAEDIKVKVKDFISKALNKIDSPNLKLGKVKPEHANRIQELTGVKVKGFSHELVSQDMRHAINEHGDPKRESGRTPEQIAITADDLNLIPEIINNPDDILEGSELRGRKSVKYKKQFEDGTIFYVEVIAKKEGSLQSKTLWKWRSTLTSATHEVSPDNTSEIASSVSSPKRPSVGVNAVQVAPPDYTSENTNSPSGKSSGESRVPRFDSKITKDSVAVKPSSKISTPASISELPSKERKITDALTKRGTVNIVSDAMAKQVLEQSGQQADGLIQGFVLNGKAYIVPENIESGKMWDVIRHEVGTHIGQMLHDDAEFNNLKDTIAKRKDEKSPTGEAIRKAYERAEAADTKPEFMTEEVLGYLVEDAPNTSIARRIIALIKKYLQKMGIYINLSQADMVALADIAVRREANRRDKANMDNSPKTKKTSFSILLNLPFKEQLQKFLNNPSSEELIGVSDTPEILLALGAKQLPITVTSKVLRKVSFGKHQGDISAIDLESLPEKLKDPIAVFESKTQAGSLVLMLEMVDNKKNTVVVPVFLNQENRRHIVNSIGSIYGKDNDNWFKEQIDEGRLKYVNTKKIREWHVIRGLQLPKMRGDIHDFDNNILTETDFVKQKETNNPDIRFSIAPTQTQQAFTIPEEETRKDGFVRRVVDDINSLVKIVDSIRKSGKTVTTNEDIVQKERLRTSKMSYFAERMNRIYTDPIVKTLGKNGYQLKEFESFLHAKHASEANDHLKVVRAKGQLQKLLQVKEKNQLDTKDLEQAISDIATNRQKPNDPMAFYQLLQNELAKINTNSTKAEIDFKTKTQSDFSKLSGMTTEEANKILADIKKNAAKNKIYEDLSKLYYQMNNEALDLQLALGAMTQDRYDQIKKTYKNYVPLHREGFAPSRPNRDSVRGGSTRTVVDILSNSIASYENAIAKAHNAELHRTLYNLVTNNPNDDFWYIEQNPKMKADLDSSGNVKYVLDRALNNNEMEIWIDGKPKVLWMNFNNQHAMNLLNVLDKSRRRFKSSEVVQVLSKFNRMLAATNTSWFVEFLLSNPIKDYQSAMVNVSDTILDDKRKSITKAIPQAMGAIKSVLRAKDNTLPSSHPLYSMFKFLKLAQC